LTAPTKWFDSVQSNGAARLRLFCFAHAGGAASFFAHWSRRLPADVEVWPIQLPGRWARWREEPLRDLVAASGVLARELTPELTAKPYLFYGHSLGGLIAYETTLRLREQGRAMPKALVISGRTPPDAPPSRPPLHRLPDEAFIRGIAEHYEAVDARLLADPETRAMVLKVLRADLQMFETYRALTAAPLYLPIWAFAARGDRAAAPSSMDGWKRFSTREVELHEFDGGHFFVRNNELVWRQLSDVLART